MQLQFDFVSELGEPGSKFKNLYNLYWPSYKTWINSKDSANTPDLASSFSALKEYMPEMIPTYNKICELVNADDVTARFLTGFQPPSYINACSQAVIARKKIQLVRNYDYHPDLMEGTLLLSSWNGKKVIATVDFLVGVLDGMNEDGLAISLTFGGRKVKGDGFGITMILRYVLEFCSNVEEAVSVLTRIPSQVAYNVTVVDKSGNFKTVLLSPDRDAIVTDYAFTTNHQIEVEWYENAEFNKTMERSIYLEKILSKKGMGPKKLADSFLKKPLYNTLFNEGFGTLYTSVYQPAEGTMQLRWLKDSVFQSFDNFKEGSKIIKFKVPAQERKVDKTWSNAGRVYWKKYQK